MLMRDTNTQSQFFVAKESRRHFPFSIFLRFRKPTKAPMRVYVFIHSVVTLRTMVNPYVNTVLIAAPITLVSRKIANTPNVSSLLYRHPYRRDHVCF